MSLERVSIGIFFESSEGVVAEIYAFKVSPLASDTAWAKCYMWLMSPLCHRYACQMHERYYSDRHCNVLCTD